MAKEKTVDEAYKQCEEDGFFIEIAEVDSEKLKTMLQLTETLLGVAEDVKKNLDKTSQRWSVIYIMYYDVLRELVNIIVHLEKKKIINHQCLFAYLCKHRPELELDWNFFEKVRTRRNGVQYYGSLATYEHWKEVEVQMKLYISILKKEVQDKLSITKKSK